METIEKLPAGNYIVGAKEVAKAIKSRRIDMVVFAKNCPDFITEKIMALNREMKACVFNGDQKHLGTRLGKPFPLAVAGHEPSASSVQIGHEPYTPSVQIGLEQ